MSATDSRYLGIDQSLTGTGLCVVATSGHILTLSTVATRDLRGGARLAFIRDAVVAAIEQHGPIGRACIEGYSMGSINRPFDLGEVGGVVRLALTDARVEVHVVAPMTLKLFATGHGHSKKPDMIAAARALGVEVSDDNQADALFLAWAARAIGTGCAVKRCELDALKTVLNPIKRRRVKRPRRLVPSAI